MKAHMTRENMKRENAERDPVSDGQTVRITGKGPYHGHPIRLTIALIVKNEEKTLERCLNSLQPLRDAVESELIVTDTGSTDRTVEIAKKYTDHIIHFQWCNDFAAARNTGVEAARGEWFLFLDGDEWFENTGELIGFFTGGECDRYGSATYIVRNYSDYSGKKFGDFNALRLTRMYPGFRFEHIVHEDFARLLPTKVFSAYVHHYGYVFQTEAEHWKKHCRNAELLKKALEQDPNDLKMYFQLAQEYFSTGETALVQKYSEMGLSVEREHPDRKRRLMFYHNIVKALFLKGEFESVLQCVDEVTRADSDENIFWLDYYYYAQASAFQLNKYERSVSYGQGYLRIWNRRQAGKLDPDMELALDFEFIRPLAVERVLLWILQANLKLGRYLPAAKMLEAVTFSEKSSFLCLPALTCEYCARTGDWKRLSAFYHTALSEQGRPYWEKLIGLLENSLSGWPEQSLDAAQAIAALEDGEDAYVRLCRLRAAEAAEDTGTAKRELDWFSQWEGDWNPALSDAVFYGMKEKINMLPIFLNIEPEDVKLYIEQMLRRHGSFKKVARDYLNSFSYDSVKGLLWVLRIRECLLSGESGEETEDDEIRLFEEYAGEAARYVRMLYRPELLSPERVSALPRAHRFGYYMGCALSARIRSDGISYLSNLRLALHSYPVMKRQISILLDRFEREKQQRQQKADEFRSLAKQVKENIRALIAQGRLEEAGQYTVQLARLMPDDPDVVRFRTLTHTEPDMNELAARLPQ